MQFCLHAPLSQNGARIPHSRSGNLYKFDKIGICMYVNNAAHTCLPLIVCLLSLVPLFSISLSPFLSPCLSSSVSLCFSICLSASVCLHLCLSPPLSLSPPLPVCLCQSLSPSLSHSLSLPLCLSASRSNSRKQRFIHHGVSCAPSGSLNVMIINNQGLSLLSTWAHT